MNQMLEKNNINISQPNDAHYGDEPAASSHMASDNLHDNSY